MQIQHHVEPVLSDTVMTQSHTAGFSVNVVKFGTTMIARDLMNEDQRHLNAFCAKMQTKV